MVSQNKVLKGIFGPKRKEVTGGSRKVDEGLVILQQLLLRHEIKKGEMDRTCSTRERNEK